jgi:hypothetical protein
MPDDRGNGGIKVMEHREPPRIASGDRPLESAATHNDRGPFRLRRFDEAGKKRTIDYPRAGVIVLGALVLASGFFWAKRASLDWLADQPQYQVPFDQIQLVDASGQPNQPPGWYHGGARVFLENVRIASREPEAVSVLQLTADRLSQVFKNYAWVEDVIRVHYGPGSIRVELRYRQPVAWVQLRGGDQKMVDHEGTILPAKDIDVAALGRVIKILGDLNDGGLAPPSDDRDGVKWKCRAGAPTVEEVDTRILAAARLAGFLTREEQARDAEKSAALNIVGIVVTDFQRRGLFVKNNEDAAILWGYAPESKRPDTPSTDEKWAMLRRWAETTEARRLVAEDYWEFSRNGVRFVCPHPRAAHRPTSSGDRNSGKRDAP